MINTDKRIGRNAMFAQLGFEKIPAISSWGEYISDVLMLQVHRADLFKHKDTAYVRVLENKDYKGNRGGLKRVEHVEAIKQGAKAYLFFDETAKSQAYDGYVYELNKLHELVDGTYVSIKRRLTVGQFINR